MQCDWFMYHLRSNYKNRLEFPFNHKFNPLLLKEFGGSCPGGIVFYADLRFALLARQPGSNLFEGKKLRTDGFKSSPRD